MTLDDFDFSGWMAQMNYTTDKDAARALQLSIQTVRNYRRGARVDAATVEVPHTVKLACLHLLQEQQSF